MTGRAPPEDFELQKDYALNFFLAKNFDIEAKWKSAATEWQKSRELATSNIEIVYTWVHEARVWMNAKSYDRAVVCLEEALKINPNSTRAKTLLGKIAEERTAAK